MVETKILEKVNEEEIDMLVDLIDSIKLLRDYLNDQVIQDLAKILSSMFKLINIMSSTDLIEILERALQDPQLDKALLNPPSIGLGGLIKALRDKEVQKGLGIIIELLKAIGRTSAN